LAARIRKCAWDEFEIQLPWAELVIEAESPVLMHGTVADVLIDAERLLAVLREAGIKYIAEGYNERGELLREFRSMCE
jgi:lysophospholipid acyltransferase (LPLAT)-like uncharacterized protein